MPKLKTKIEAIKKEIHPHNFEAIRLSLASPEEILEWSYGEVIKPETINYRTQRPERDGLFDERIFGPTKDYECYCGKYKKIRYRGVICDRCGVEVTRSSVRRERMGHIDLAVPVAHIWYLHGVPSVLSTVLNIPVGELEKVIYFAAFVILSVNEELRTQALKDLEEEYLSLKQSEEFKSNPVRLTGLEGTFRAARQEIDSLFPQKILSEAKYHELSLKYGDIVKVAIGAEAIFEILKSIDLNQTIKELEGVKEKETSGSRKILRRLKLLSEMKKAGVKPEWLILTRIPVIPPDLRPMVQLDGGRFAASDLNDLYRRVLNRNNRLKRLTKQGAPEVIQRNEKRMLQEAVDGLIDNSARRGRVATIGTGRKLRSLSDILRGKQGRFRQNLLGKRVDYSGRSVIVVGPRLKLHQAGIPKTMALELFKTFVISKLIRDGHVHNVKNASRMIEKGEPIVWDILEEVTKDFPVLLNRAPTLHRLGIQAFQPVLIEGKAIQVHPLVCYAFNADFDGDQMAVHVPLSLEARKEAKELMLSTKNVLKPASGEPVVTPRLDMVMGAYWLTTFKEGAKGEGKIFASKNEAIMAWQVGFLDLRAKIKVRMGKPCVTLRLEIVETSVGRILFNNILPEGHPFLNESMDSRRLKWLIKDVFNHSGIEETVSFVDRIKDLTFEYATYSGITISVNDIYVPEDKEKIVKEAEKKGEEIEAQYRRGLITLDEKSLKVTELWLKVRNELETKIIEGVEPENPVYAMVASGARGSMAQVNQMGGMKGLVVNPAGEIIEVPIKSNYKEGLSVYEYFISTHGSRKGKSDTSLRTSEAGYLTRRLVDVAQNVVIQIKDCGTSTPWILSKGELQTVGEKFEDKILGRVAFEDIKIGKKVVVKKNEGITEEKAKQILESKGIEEVKVRSVLTCESHFGLCQLCYGRDLATGRLVELGTAVGIMAAQAIGEPGTQLTMKTFHLGGIQGEDITSGLPRVEEIFEARRPRTLAQMAEIPGVISIYKEKDHRVVVITSDNPQKEKVNIPQGYKVLVKEGETVKPKQTLATKEGGKALRAKIAGKISIHKTSYKDREITITSKDLVTLSYQIGLDQSLRVKSGDKVEIGQSLTSGHLDLSLALRLHGKERTQKYIIGGVKEIYASQGQDINDKHIEIIIREMFSKAKVIDSGGSELFPGEVVDQTQITVLNENLKKKKAKPVKTDDVVMGITRVALKTESFLSAASFQETTSVLIGAATRGAVDYLKGLKENVIIGKLIPAGTGFKK